MRTLSTLLLITITSLSSGQDWALINPAYRYNYSDDGTDTISNQIRVMDVDTLGVDSFRFELNRIGVICPSCSPGYSPTCSFGGETDMIRSTTAQVWGHRALRFGSSWLLIGETDSLLVRPTEPLGSTWTGPGGVTGTVYSTDEADVLGALDSLKWSAFSNGDTVAYSRDHGIVFSDRASMGTFELIGRDGVTEEGQHFPRVVDLFDYQVGDVLQYHDESSFQSSFCVHFVDGRTRYEVLARVDDGAVTTYTLERTYASDEESYYPQWWTPCGNYHYEGQEQISLIVDHDRFTLENLFSSRVLGPLYPSAITEFSAFEPLNGIPTRIQSRFDALGRYVIEPYIMNEGWAGSVLCPTMEDSSMFFPDGNMRHLFSFTERIGLTYSDFYYFEGGATRTLEGYILSGEQWGSVWSSSAILDTPEMSMERISIHPNPASSELYVNDARVGSMLAITDLQGRFVHQQRITTEDTRIELLALHAGSYLLIVDGFTPQRFVVAR